MTIVDELRRLVQAFRERRIDYALCGGLAMAVYARPRATLDIDLMIDEASLAAAMGVAEELGFGLRSMPMEFGRGKVKIQRLHKVEQTTGEEMALDLLIVTPATREAWDTRRKIDWMGGEIQVLSPEGLIYLKGLRDAGVDRQDIEYLRGLEDGTETED